MKKSFSQFWKTSLFSAFFLLGLSSLQAQTPSSFSYQALIRDASNQILSNQSVGMQISIRQNQATGTPVYRESFSLTSNANGLVSLEVGQGSVSLGQFDSINWAEGPYFIQSEIDPTGGSNYSISGTTQIMSVPYALHAKSAESVSGLRVSFLGDSLFFGEDNYIIVKGLSASNPRFSPAAVNCASGPTLIRTVFNPATGKTWMDRNLGASQVATSFNDSAAYGDYYQWGRFSDGHQCANSSTRSTISASAQPGHGDFIVTSSASSNWLSTQDTTLWKGLTGTNNPCPSGFRLPTAAELNAERSSWSVNTRSGAFASPLRWAAGGNRTHTGSFASVGSGGVYYGSTTSSNGVSYLFFTSSTAGVAAGSPVGGACIRCILDE